jgi:hypothetical protein
MYAKRSVKFQHRALDVGSAPRSSYNKASPSLRWTCSVQDVSFSGLD